MPLPSFLQRKPLEKPAAASEGGPVEAARLRARRRLIGAIVLLAIGIVGFPLVFETQPRPVAVDIPIELPRGMAAEHPASAPVVAAIAPVPAAVETELPPAAASAASLPPPAPEKATPPPVAVPAARPAARTTTAAASEPAATRVAAKPSAPAQERVPVTAARAPASAARTANPASSASPSPPAAHGDDGARALALLEGDSNAAPAASQRFVVQVGAYTDSSSLHEARQKVEKLGYKTYTQVITTEAGARTRVRVGPFANHQQAAEVGAKLKSAGLPVAILGL